MAGISATHLGLQEHLRMAPRVGFEPTTNGLTVHCSTAELPRNGDVKAAKE